MDLCRPCGCKGRRSCLICEAKYDIEPVPPVSPEDKRRGYVFCDSCEKAWPGWDISDIGNCPDHSGESISVQGIHVTREFINAEEQIKLLEGMKNEAWELSQSGRRKQNYGPKCNFKKNKIHRGDFTGFPMYSKFVQDKFSSLPILKNFYVIEQCSLRYNPDRGAANDPHIDDCWIWGERIVTVNVLGDTYLTLSRYKGNEDKYNLHKVRNYPRVLDENGCVLDPGHSEPFHLNLNNQTDDKNADAILRIYMPVKSLIILYGSARYEWEHYVLREDIKSLRICIAYREFTPTYLKGGEKEESGIDILNITRIFW